LRRHFSQARPPGERGNPRPRNGRLPPRVSTRR
jgi:hypothetical protein